MEGKWGEKNRVTPRRRHDQRMWGIKWQLDWLRGADPMEKNETILDRERTGEEQRGGKEKFWAKMHRQGGEETPFVLVGSALRGQLYRVAFPTGRRLREGIAALEMSCDGSKQASSFGRRKGHEATTTTWGGRHKEKQKQITRQVIPSSVKESNTRKGKGKGKGKQRWSARRRGPKKS